MLDQELHRIPRNNNSIPRKKFISDRFKKINSNMVARVVISGVQSYNSLGAGENYHDPLRIIYDKIRNSNKLLTPELILCLSVNKMNYKMNYDGLFPTLIVYGVLPRFKSIKNPYLNQEELMKSVQMSRTLMETITSNFQLIKALKSNILRSIKNPKL